MKNIKDIKKVVKIMCPKNQNLGVVFNCNMCNLYFPEVFALCELKKEMIKKK